MGDSSSADFAPLLNPVSLGSVALRNRVIMSALTRDRSVPTNVPNHVNLEYYEQRAKGGAGLIITEGILIVQQGTEWQHAPGIWSQEQITAWKKITDAVHAQGGKIFAQLWHLGRVSHPDAPEQIASGNPVYAPSAISARGGKFRFLPGVPGYVKPTEIPDPSTIIAQFKQAAINAKEAGFDGVELHGANGYLVTQFLDNTANLRTDQWGGSYINRCRFGLEILKVFAEIWGADKVGVKLSPAGGYNDVGMSLEDTIETYSHFVKEADALGLAYICLLRYAAKLDLELGGKLRATQHDVLGTYGPLIKRAAVLLNGDVTPVEAAQLISEGRITAAVFGWLWIAHPDVAVRLQKGKPLDGEVILKALYGNGLTDIESQKHGYTDYPFAP